MKKAGQQKKKKKPKRNELPVIRQNPTSQEGRILKKFSKIVGVEVAYHEPAPGMKIKHQHLSGGPDPKLSKLDSGELLLTTYAGTHILSTRENLGEKFLATAGELKLKSSDFFTPDGRFTHNNQKYALEIKDRLKMGTSLQDTIDTLNLILKYGEDHHLILIGQNTTIPASVRKSKKIEKVNLFDKEELPALKFMGIKRDKETGEWRDYPIYIIDWSEVETLAKKRK